MADEERRWVAVTHEVTVHGPPWTIHDVEGVQVTLVRDDAGEIHAVGAACPHLDAPMTSAEVADGIVSCPRHWYEFSLQDGSNLLPGWEDCSLPVHPCRVVGGTVEVAVEDRA